MKIEQIYTGCLAHGAYYIESNGEAVIIDPLREVGPYIEKAEADNAQCVTSVRISNSRTQYGSSFENSRVIFCSAVQYC